MTVSAEQLQSLILRIERLEEEKAQVAANIKDVYAESKSAGFDTKIMKAIIRLRKLTTPEIEEQDALMDAYKIALGMTTEDENDS